MVHPRLRRLTCAAGAALPAMASAHDAGRGALDPWAWNLEPWVVAPLGLALLLYWIGVQRLWSRAGKGRGIARREVACFAAGWLTLVAALLSPIDVLGGSLFSMHMVQHELLMVVAAPLFVVARPLEAWTWGLPRAWRAPLAAAGRWKPAAALWRALTAPVGAWLFHAAAVWGWHIPVLFDMALHHEGWHALQHATFLASALAFWWSVVNPRADTGGAGLASAFTTMLHTGALGALLTFAPRPWYGLGEGPTRWGLTALEDQQLGGLVMWVLGGLPYLLAGLALVHAWIARQAPGHSEVSPAGSTVGER